jgi:hypothetical protein
MTDQNGPQKYVSPDGWEPASRNRTPKPVIYKPLDVLSVLAIVSALAVTGFAIISGLLVWTSVDDYRRAIDTRTEAWDVLVWADLASLPLIGSLVAAYVCTCLWLGRVRANSMVLTLGRAHHRREQVWVWLGWWVPIVSLWFPFQVVEDVRNASVSPTERHRGSLGLWWTAWLTLAISWRISDRMAVSNHVLSEGEITFMALTATISAVAAAVGGFLWVRLVLEISRAQEATARLPYPPQAVR